MPNCIQQTIEFEAPIERVYSALTNAEDFSGFTGEPSSISGKAGGAFQGFAGKVSGRTVELIENRRIVQAWRVEFWPEGVYSIVKFELIPTDSGTTLSLEQAGYPDDAHDHLESGWHKMYWEPLANFLARS